MLARRATAAPALAMLVVATLGVGPSVAQAASPASGLAGIGPILTGLAAAAPVTLIGLTDTRGNPTDIAVDGLEELSVAPSSAPAVEAPMSGVVGALSSGGGATSLGRVVWPRETAAIDEPVSAEALEGIAILTPAVPADQFLVVGLTWAAGDELPDGARAFVRVQEDDEWSEWLEIEAEDADGAVGPGGTEPFVTGGAAAVQVQVTGDASALPASLQLSLIPANPVPAQDVITEAPAEQPSTLPTEEPIATVENASSVGATGATIVAASTRQAGVQAAAAPTFVTRVRAALTAGASSVLGGAPTAVSSPTIISRASWGADPALNTWAPTYATLKAAVVHHTAGTNTYTAAQSASVVRGIYYYHAVTRAWGDIGYNFLVDKYGQIFEGRVGSLAAAPGVMTVGAHAAGFNTGSLGISAMGDYTQVTTPQLILDTMADVIAWRFSLAGINPTTTSGFTSPGTATLVAGQALPRIFAHRDVGATTCPGADIYGRLTSLRTGVATRIAAAAVQANTAPIANAGPDRTVMTGETVSLAGKGTDSDGDPLTYRWTQTAGATVTLSSAMVAAPTFVAPTTAGSLTFSLIVGDGKVTSAPDTVTITAAAPVPAADVHDFTGDGAADVVARDSAGTRWLYPGDGRGGFLPRVQGGSGWNDMTALVGPGDWNGDRAVDLIARDATGVLWLYPGDGKGGFGTRVQVGSGWLVMNALVGPGDWNGDRAADLLARDGMGALWLYPGDGKGGFGTRVQVGSGWLVMNALVGPGDWNGDGAADLLARDGMGALWLYPGDGRGGFGTRVQVGSGWQGMTALVGPGDWNGDGAADLLARDGMGALWLYPGDGKGGFGTWLQVGWGWNGMTAIV